jgi:hypothetical protein
VSVPVVTLPLANGRSETFRLGAPSPFAATAKGPFVRQVLAAAHVVADPFADRPWLQTSIDWDATLAFRHHLWDLGFKIAEAMDTSQRGMGLDWPTARQLIERSCAAARGPVPDALACGAGTDQLAAEKAVSLAQVVDAYEEQLEFIEAKGAQAIIMASRALCRIARSPDDYLAVYDRLLRQTRHKVILHWLGDMFDPELRGYWGSSDPLKAMQTCLSLIENRRERIEGVKISLLDPTQEIRMRRQLPAGVLMYTGDDFHFAAMMAGDREGHSHGLLGIFDAIAPAAAAALAELSAGNLSAYHAILDPTVPLSRRIFEAPTQFYKAGLVLLAWLNGFQDHFIMVGGLQSARGILHYADVLRLADQARLLRDPDLAAHRMRALCRLNGIEQSYD